MVYINSLVVDVNSIIENCKLIYELVRKKNNKLFILIKSNMYGFGYGIINYILDYFDGFVVKDISLLSKIKEDYNNKKVIILYDVFSSIDKIEENIFITDMYLKSSSKKQNLYIRLDPFLGLHGISLEDFFKIDKFDNYSGVLIYINEYLDNNELDCIYKIIQFCSDKNLNLNIGGTKILDYIKYIDYKNVEYRILRGILFSNSDKSTMFLETSILNTRIIKKEINIGFKSDSIKVKKGFVVLLSFGYADFKLLSRLYQEKISLFINGYEFIIPCYPCMNTMWIYSDEIHILPNKVKLFENFNDVISICKKLDIDIDEFYTSFSDEIKRVYS